MKIKKTFICLIMFTVICTTSFAQTGIVHDPINNIPIVSNWLTAIDTLYTNYDMIMNSISSFVRNDFPDPGTPNTNAFGFCRCIEDECRRQQQVEARIVKFPCESGRSAHYIPDESF